ncbi:hypothetical protein F2Q68_00043810 [Brassica cretica]|uniref:Uncharacterized protein n=1 Tax=Brassica cretica TaxID=69181 RepID=A0A8S9LL66_BRACR|nr:hypothetical protein F2Q68_00043810 [Brassica cretica]
MYTICQRILLMQMEKRYGLLTIPSSLALCHRFSLKTCIVCLLILQDDNVYNLSENFAYANGKAIWFVDNPKLSGFVSSILSENLYCLSSYLAGKVDDSSQLTEKER